MNAVKTILFVENDPVALQMYSHRLEREGFHIESAQDGLEALKQVSQLTPDLVVLDMMLPKLSGDEVLKFMRSDPGLKNLPVVIFSNASASQWAADATMGGPTKRLLKSDCTFQMLLQTVQDLLAAGPDTVSIPVTNSETTTTPRQTGTHPPAASPAMDKEVARAHSQFLTEAIAEIPKIREHCFAYIKAPASPASLQHLPNLYQRVHFLSASAAKAGCARVAMLAKTFDALLSEIMVKPSWVTPSVLQTIAQAVDCLNLLLKCDEGELSQPMPQAKVLAVDDDAVCNHVIVSTLKRANFDAKSITDPVAALQLLESTRYQLVLLDINMPGLTGFELCEKLRRIPHCKTIPVIFITGHNNFDNRKQSVLSGGHDFITKPVSPSELALKATIHLLKTPAQGGTTLKEKGTEPGIAALSKCASTQAGIAAPTETGNGAANQRPSAALLPQAECTTPFSSEDAQSDTASPRSHAGIPASSDEIDPNPAALPQESQAEAIDDVSALAAESPNQSKQHPPTATSVLPCLEAAEATTETGTTSPAEAASPIGNSIGSKSHRSAALGGSSSGRIDTAETPASDLDIKFDTIAIVVAKIMFEDENPTPRNLRLVRLALEQYNIREILKGPIAVPQNGSQVSIA